MASENVGGGNEELSPGRTADRTDTIAGLQQQAGRHSPECGGSGVDAEDRSVLVPGNPRLLELGGRYEAATSVMGEPPIWKAGHVRPEDLLYFRGDNAYVWQHRDGNHLENYILTYFYLKEMDHLGLFDRLREDADYGVFACPTGQTDRFGQARLVSRDLLDSINEILFLDRVLAISLHTALRILDIGAGYGRLAYRAVLALDNLVAYYCIDAVPCSTFLCEYYLRRKRVTERAITVPFDDQETLPGQGAISLAINIHSFSECSSAAVNNWIGRCGELGIKYIFVVPNNSGKGGDALRFSVGNGDFRPQLEEHGYKLQHAEPKYRNPEIQKYGISPAWYYLFERD